MIKQVIIISSIVINLIMIDNIGDIRCQENSNIIAEQYQYDYTERISKKINEDNLKDDKNIGVEILGLIIQRNLFYEYQKTDSEELEDRLKRGR